MDLHNRRSVQEGAKREEIAKTAWPSGAIIAMVLASWAIISPSTSVSAPDRRLATFANPVDLPYRYQPPEAPGQPYREAADPTLIRFKGRYWLFASHSLGYWWSINLRDWTFVEGRGYDVGKFAPTVMEMNGRLYLAASEKASKIWVTEDPLAGVWTEAAQISPGYEDPALFLDDDRKVYVYNGLHWADPLHVSELDAKTFQPLRSADIPQSRSKETRGWEVGGDTNENQDNPSFIEGGWMTKHGGKYYFQYAGPGTELKTYADGVLVGDHPMGPFVYQDHNPFSAKPTGFIAGAGHGSTLQASDGRWWHAATMTISRRHIFERRIGLFPASFTSRGELVADTYLGDYPRYLDGARQLTGWMLLSRKKAVKASSSLEGARPGDAVDEDVRTWWSAATGDAGEWLEIDLGAMKTIEAVQINFADQDSQGRGISQDIYAYVLELSDDGQAWRTAIDKSVGGRDAPHDYQVLPAASQARFVRLRNVHAPDGGKFSLSDLRVFGAGEGRAPAAMGSPSVRRDPADGRKARIDWQPAERAEFYIVRIGPRPDLLNQNYQVYDAKTSLNVASLSTGVQYCYAVDAVNENGVTRGDKTICPR